MSQIQVPKGWNEEKISDIIKPLSLTGKKIKNHDFQNVGKIPIIDQGKELIGGYSDNLECKIHVNEPLVIFGDHTRAIKYVDFDFAPGADGTKVLKVAEKIIPKYFYYYLKSIKLENKGYSRHFKILKQHSIVFPDDKNIQSKIVKKLDYILEQFEEKKKEILELSNLEKTQQIISKNIEQLLKTALEGKLTKDWRNAHKTKLEPSSILLKQILRNRRKKWEDEQLAKFKAINKNPKDSKWKDKYKEPLTSDSNLPELPDLWIWVTLNQITWSVKDGPHYSPEYVEKGIPFISGGNVRPSGVNFINAKQISQKLHAELSKRCKPEKNDILYTKGGTTGIARVNTYEHEFNVWVHIAILKLVNPIEPFYVQHALNSPFCYSQAQNFTHGVGNQDLGLTRMIRIVLPLPPLEEQLEIIKILDQKFVELEYVNNKINEIMIKKQSIINYVNKISSSVLNEAFTGKLVN